MTALWESIWDFHSLLSWNIFLFALTNTYAENSHLMAGIAVKAKAVVLALHARSQVELLHYLFTFAELQTPKIGF